MGGLVSTAGTLFGQSNDNANYKAVGADIQNPVTQAQIGTSYDQSQNALAQQNQLIQALQAQQGIQNQSNVFNQLQGVANGTGPNPAQAQLNQATGANVANQAALMAGQRGAGANVGLLARQAAMQGANTQQQAVGQGATLQANQSLNALGQLGGIAGQQVAQQQQAVTGANQFAQGEQQNLLGAQGSYNNAQVSNTASANNANENLAAVNANNTAKGVGGLFNASGATSVLGGITGGKAHGGMIENPKVAQVAASKRFSGALAPHIEHLARIYHPQMFADGGDVMVAPAIQQADPIPQQASDGGGGGGGLGSLVSLAALLSNGGQVNDLHRGGQSKQVGAMVSPGEGYLAPEKVKEVAKGANPVKEAEKIPGKAKVKGDSQKNDIVPAKLEEGGIVIPRSVMDSEDPVAASKKFVMAAMKKHGSPKDHEDFKKALKASISSRKN